MDSRPRFGVRLAGPQIALVATARKLCVLFWHLLTREQDYAFGRPSLTRHKLRRLELMAGDPPRRGRRSGSGASKREQRHERELSEQVEQAYRRLVADWQQAPNNSGAGATPGRASSSHQTGQAARHCFQRPDLRSAARTQCQLTPRLVPFNGPALFPRSQLDRRSGGQSRDQQGSCQCLRAAALTLRESAYR
jgi:hypothetical protein